MTQIGTIDTDSLILAAYNQIGAQRNGETNEQYEYRLRRAAINLKMLMDPRGRVVRGIYSTLGGMLGDTEYTVKPIQGTIIGGGVENQPSPGKTRASQRLIVMLKTEPTGHKYSHPKGHELVRTEPVYTVEGEAMEKEVRGLIYHKVFMLVQVEEYGGGKARVLRYLEDRGVDWDLVVRGVDGKPEFDKGHQPVWNMDLIEQMKNAWYADPPKGFTKSA